MKIQDFFEEFLQDLRMKGRTEKCITEHKRMLDGALTHSVVYDMELSDLKKSDISSVMQSGLTHGAHGGQRAIMTYRMLLQYIEDKGIKVPFNFNSIKLPHIHTKEKTVLTKDEVEMILRAFPINSGYTPTRNMAKSMRCVCEVLIGTGMRISECLSLKRRQFDEIKSRQETVIVAKGGNERPVFFTDRAVRALEEYLLQRVDRCEKMFVNSYGDELTFNRFRNYLQSFRWQFPEHIRKHLSSHIFRRSRATWLYLDGMDFKSAQRVFGWKSERTPLKYYWKVDESKAKERFLEMTKNSNV